jgi:hypothetical protein
MSRHGRLSASLKKEIYNEKFIKADMEKRLRELQEDFKRCTDQNLVEIPI